MPAPLGLGVVGCGRIARMFHLPVLRDLPSARLAAVADPDDDARHAGLATARGVVGVRDADALVAVPGVEAVVICLPTHLHADAAVVALEASRHVYVEKPLAVDVAEARRIRDAWLASGTTGAVGFNLRFHPLYRAAREAVRSGRLGELVGVRSVFSSAARDLPEWKRARRTGGGALLDLASHHVDLVRYLLDDDVTSVSAAIRSVMSEQDTAALNLHLGSGLVAQLMATISAAQSDRVEILGTVASLHVDRMGGRRLQVVPARGPHGRVERLAAAGRAVRGGLLDTVDRLRPPPEPSFRAALGAFVDAARAGTPAGPSIEDGLRSLAVIEAAERSAATGERVTVTVAAGNGTG
jgi:predicted dehydrogenase